MTRKDIILFEIDSILARIEERLDTNQLCNMADFMEVYGTLNKAVLDYIIDWDTHKAYMDIYHHLLDRVAGIA